MKAILGMGTVVSNANTVNRGQMADLPLGTVVENNHVFSENSVKPIVTNPLPGNVVNLVSVNARNIENTYYGIKVRDLNRIFEAFMDQPLCAELSYARGEELFASMVRNTARYLEPWYDLSALK